MKSGTLVCQGATCSCTMAGGATAKMQVKTNTKHFINDADGTKKPIATDMQRTVASLNFGTCKPGTPAAHPCTAQLKWNNFYQAVELENGGSPLLKKSTAQCSSDGGIITILKHGQTESVSAGQVEQAAKDVQAQLNPMASLRALKEVPDDLKEGLTGKIIS